MTAHAVSPYPTRGITGSTPGSVLAERQQKLDRANLGKEKKSLYNPVYTISLTSKVREIREIKRNK